MGTKSRPNIITLEKIETLSKQILELMEEKKRIIAEVVEKYGPGEYLYELEKPNEDGKKFVRYKLIDHLDEFKSGTPLWKSTAFERFGSEVKYLKNLPKES